MEKVTCGKKDQYGNHCTREAGHRGVCISKSSYYQAGWIDQGARPARRKFFLWLASVGALMAICAWIISLNGLGWLMLALLVLVLAMPTGGIRSMINEYRKERSQ